MDGQERLIRKLFTRQYCRRCGCPYQSENLLILVRRSDVWMVMIRCIDCQQKDTFVVKFPQQEQGRNITSYRLSEPPAASPLPEEPRTPAATPRPISADDVLEMHLFLKNFNGDFQRLFAEVE